MISIDSHETFISPWADKSAWADKSDIITERSLPNFDEVPCIDTLGLASFFSPGPNPIDDFYGLDLGIDINDLELEKSSYDFSKLGLSPVKSAGMSLVDEYFFNCSLNKPVSEKVPDPVSCLVEKQYAPLSPDSGIEQDGLNASFDECADVFGLMEQDRDVEGMCEPVKLNNDSELDKYLEDMLQDKIGDTDDEIFKSGVFSINLSEIIDSEYSNYPKIKSEPLDDDSVLRKTENGFEHSRNDSVTTDHWLNEGSLNPVPTEEDFSALCSGLVLQPVKKECNKLNIKDELSDDNLFVLKSNSQTIQIEHSYFKKPCVIESDEEEEEPVKKRKRNDIDEDFSPYQKPKRKAGRPRTNFSKTDSQKTQRLKLQKTKSSKRTTQTKKLKSCSTVPFDRREQHNQAERERRDMLKRNLDIVEDITPDHVLHLTQIALQSEKTSKSDELENNENNFTVDVLKKLDELIKREPVSHRPKYKKASRNSKMVVLLGSTYYIGSLEKELKAKESRLAQIKKQYEECLKRLNPKVSSKKIRRNY